MSSGLKGTMIREGMRKEDRDLFDPLTRELGSGVHGQLYRRGYDKRLAMYVRRYISVKLKLKQARRRDT